jgi:hypothetical protein
MTLEAQRPEKPSSAVWIYQYFTNSEEYVFEGLAA